MVVNNITLAEREGRKNWCWAKNNAEWEEVEKAIESLDGNQRTLITLNTPDDSQMLIAGGAQDCYTVQATFDWRGFSALALPERGGQKEILLNGQLRACPARNVVGRKLALAAAKAFALLGALESRFTWDLV